MKLITFPIRSFSSSPSIFFPRKPPTAPKYPLPSPSSSSSSSSSSPSWYAEAPSKYTSPFTSSSSTPGSSSDAVLSPAPAAPPAWFLPSTSPTSLDTSIASPLRRPSFLPPPPRTAFASLAQVPNPPPALPKPLHGLWTFLYTMPLLHNDSVKFLDTKKPAPKTIPIPDYPPVHGRRKRGPVDGGPSIGGTDVGGYWDWVVVCEVEGRGAGEVLRTEGAIREWLSRNPLNLHGHPSDVSERVRRPSKSEPAVEWSLIDTDVGVVIHVMTPAARLRWGVEGIWATN